MAMAMAVVIGHELSWSGLLAGAQLDRFNPCPRPLTLLAPRGLSLWFRKLERFEA